MGLVDDIKAKIKAILNKVNKKPEEKPAEAAATTDAPAAEGEVAPDGMYPLNARRTRI